MSFVTLRRKSNVHCLTFFGLNLIVHGSIYLFGGYDHQLIAIQWRPPEDYIVLSHADGTAFVWQVSNTRQIPRMEPMDEVTEPGY